MYLSTFPFARERLSLRMRYNLLESACVRACVRASLCVWWRGCMHVGWMHSRKHEHSEIRVGNIAKYTATGIQEGASVAGDKRLGRDYGTFCAAWYIVFVR